MYDSWNALFRNLRCLGCHSRLEEYPPRNGKMLRRHGVLSTFLRKFAQPQKALSSSKVNMHASELLQCNLEERTRSFVVPVVPENIPEEPKCPADDGLTPCGPSIGQVYHRPARCSQCIMPQRAIPQFKHTHGEELIELPPEGMYTFFMYSRGFSYPPIGKVEVGNDLIAYGKPTQISMRGEDLSGNFERGDDFRLGFEHS
ncbi:hypothetical protein B0H17DRAFT_307396 [Mycena rosella]|uniref:Uncharacterized protein n=1 Tax=Mycena rosella TaxID=1033263 RepID=A0AAD7DW41_MYCRO|nr:hypothetical protein B0H17DRAFT_307396 [Mycena rosella]